MNRPNVPVGVYFQACYNPALEAEIAAAKDKCYRYNALHPNDRAGQAKILSDLLGGLGENAVITPPFWCDYGYNIYVGDSFYSNRTSAPSVMMRLWLE